MEKTEPWTLARIAYASLAVITLALGIAGLFLPLLPTTPFVLIAAWAASKGSPRLHRWLWNHPQIGPLLHNWHTKGAVPGNAKWFACISMSLSWIGLLAIGMNWIILGIMAFLFLSVAAFLITRPEPD
ncbi:MAG TPA: YbaN family protein [Cellvibrio sp.]